MCNRGNAAVFAVVCALGASSDVARAQDFPNRPITFVVPYAVGARSTCSCARSRELPKSTWVDRSLSKAGQAQPAL